MSVLKTVAFVALLAAPTFATPQGRPFTGVRSLDDLLSLMRSTSGDKVVAKGVVHKEMKPKENLLGCDNAGDSEATVGCLVVGGVTYRVTKHDPFSEVFEVRNLNGDAVSGEETIKVMNYVFKMMEGLKERERKTLDSSPFGF
ncbi:hypothetical protein QR680_011444 [Steinernema hermaphroditum]|uniref:Uncharacterized protein n=1 Tax=Steinernema hermaphroditum TaxID=289476 RepID=A0AA39LY39_9BILA|nr:hypothetical protein QR680_011444 [Steinernema hermaphroditum]